MTTCFSPPENETSCALIIFAKIPVPGTVKTRLTPPLTVEEGAALYACMLQDTLAMATSLKGVTPVIFFQDDAGAGEYFRELVPGITALPQSGADLGARMKSAFAEIFNQGFSRGVIIGTDSPDLPGEHVFEAIALLEYEHTDVVFGPSEDGGYYLLALKRVWDELFSGLPWSSEMLFACSVERAKDSCLGASFLPQWYDIDTGADLLRPELLDEKSPAKNTREFLRQIISTLQSGNRPLSDS